MTTGYYFSIGNVIIDDIILPDGASRMGRLGGGAVHAVMGMRVWNKRVGLAAPVGADFASSRQLADLAGHFDLAGLKVRSQPTPRAWQLFETDGTRNEVFRTSFAEMLAICLSPSELPAFYDPPAGVHLHCSPQEVPLWVAALRQRGCELILWEPWDGFCIAENLAEFFRYAALVDVVSPNLDEARHLTGLQPPEQVLQALTAGPGARIAALRMGASGSLVADSSGNFFRIPAYPVAAPVDVTGAGNAYCGGFIVGLAESGSLQQAGWQGGVSASFALHQFGALYPLDGLAEEAGRRLAWYRQNG